MSAGRVRHARLLNICCMDMSPTMMIRLFAVHIANSSRSHFLISHTKGLKTCSAHCKAELRQTSKFWENCVCRSL